MRIPTILAAACLLLVGCQQDGCTDPESANYNPDASEEDGSCVYPPEIDGYTYEVVTIGEQVWFAENIHTTVYANGDVILAGLTDDEWTSTTEGASAVYGEGSGNCESFSPDIDACDEMESLAEYGRLYNWYAVGDARGLCPAGWHIPTEEEWAELLNYIESQGFTGTEATALKSTTGWDNWSPIGTVANGNGTDDFGFSAHPGGWREASIYPGFYAAGIYGSWWSSSPCGNFNYALSIGSHLPIADLVCQPPGDGRSVRCLWNGN